MDGGRAGAGQPRAGGELLWGRARSCMQRGRHACWLPPQAGSLLARAGTAPEGTAALAPLRCRLPRYSSPPPDLAAFPPLPPPAVNVRGLGDPLKLSLSVWYEFTHCGVDSGRCSRARCGGGGAARLQPLRRRMHACQAPSLHTPKCCALAVFFERSSPSRLLPPCLCACLTSAFDSALPAAGLASTWRWQQRYTPRTCSSRCRRLLPAPRRLGARTPPLRRSPSWQRPWGCLPTRGTPEAAAARREGLKITTQQNESVISRVKKRPA